MQLANRTEWLKQRQTGLGATDIASLVGVGFSNPQRVYADKITPIVEEQPCHPLLSIGLATEDLNARLYAEKMGVDALTQPPGITRHPSVEWMFSTLDRQAPDRIVELKYTPFLSDGWGEEMSDQIPMGYLIQTHWQMMCAAITDADVSVLSGTGEHRVYRTQYDFDLGSMLAHIGFNFWTSFVEPRQAPPEDWTHPLAVQVLDKLGSITAGTHIDLGEDAAIFARNYREFKAVAREAEANADANKTELLRLMGDAEKASTGGYVLSRIMIPEARIEAYTRKPFVRFDVREPKVKKGKS